MKQPVSLTVRSGTDGVPTLEEGATLTKRDFTPSNEVRWCPGCGDYAVLAAVQGLLPDLGLRRENMVFVSGIGCSSRFPYYLNTYGMHSIHGRAPTIATGLAVSRPDLSVWVVTGDGDALSIGGNHLIHAVRRNVNLTILLFNNRIYGLTKGQYSPTSDVGLVTKSTPTGSVDAPFNPVAVALGAGATFVARTMDSERKHLQAVLKAAAEHRGASVVEIYQNCPIFHDGAFEALKTRDESARRIVWLTDGEAMTFGPEDDQRCIVASADGGLMAVPAADRGERRPVVHRASTMNPSAAFAISQLDSPSMDVVPMGVFRDVEAPTYDDLVRAQVTTAIDDAGGPATDADLADLLAGHDARTVGDAS